MPFEYPSRGKGMQQWPKYVIIYCVSEPASTLAASYGDEGLSESYVNHRKQNLFQIIIGFARLVAKVEGFMLRELGSVKKYRTLKQLNFPKVESDIFSNVQC